VQRLKAAHEVGSPVQPELSQRGRGQAGAVTLVADDCGPAVHTHASSAGTTVASAGASRTTLGQVQPAGTSHLTNRTLVHDRRPQPATGYWSPLYQTR
jgi:hypothetical protein